MNILSIGGSDPSSGAGIQSDVKTFSNLDAYGLTVVTTITSQNTRKVTSIEPVSIKSLNAQLDSILSDFHIDAIKIGMVYNSQIIKAVRSKIGKTQNSNRCRSHNKINNRRSTSQKKCIA